MKIKTILLAAAIIATIGAMTEASAQFTITPGTAIRFGYNFTTIEGTAVSGKWKSGLNVGVTTDKPLFRNIVTRYGVYLSLKGFHKYCGQDEYYKCNYNYLEVPILAVYQKAIGNKYKLELQVGPYFSYGLFGKSESPCYNQKYKTFDEYKRFDWGANAGFGINISHFYIGSSYDFGFVSIIHHALNHCIMANVGYVF